MRGPSATAAPFTSGNFYGTGFTATTTGTGFSAPLFFGKAQLLAIKWK
jgi:hypothetical protein